jgi:hypothetical protein
MPGQGKSRVSGLKKMRPILGLQILPIALTGKGKSLSAG